MTATERLLTAAARSTLRSWSAVAGPRLSILTFHRVTRELDPLFPGEVYAQRFDELMRAVARTFKVLPLPQAVVSLQQGTLAGRSLAITFDDGYADNEEVALPILKRHGLPATFFVATGFLDGGRMWNDTVIECFRKTQREMVDLDGLGLGRLATISVGQKRAAIAKVIPVIKYMGLAQREEALQCLWVACGKPELSNQLMMKRSQVQALQRAGMEIGAHTVNHPILKAVPDDVARNELAQGRTQLESLVDSPIRTFAYPNGRPDVDYDRRHRDMAKATGFDCAVSTAVGVARPGADLYQLPRFTPWDVSTGRWLARLVLNQRNVAYKTAA